MPHEELFSARTLAGRRRWKNIWYKKNYLNFYLSSAKLYSINDDSTVDYNVMKYESVRKEKENNTLRHSRKI